MIFRVKTIPSSSGIAQLLLHIAVCIQCDSLWNYSNLIERVLVYILLGFLFLFQEGWFVCLGLGVMLN